MTNRSGDGFDRAFVEARLAEIQTLLHLRTTSFAGECGVRHRAGTRPT